MRMTFNKGDRVRLTEQAWCTNFSQRDRNRLGTVVYRTREGAPLVVVRWDGNRVADGSFAADYLELVEAAPQPPG